MTHADPVVRQALLVLGRPANPVQVLPLEDVKAIYARALRGAVPPAGLSAFRVPGDPTIYVNGDSIVYRAAANAPSPFTLLRLAATLLHEQAHDTEGEAGAYRVQADFVRARLKGVSWRHRGDLTRLLQELDAQARAREIVERRVQRRWSPTALPAHSP